MNKINGKKMNKKYKNQLELLIIHQDQEDMLIK